MKKMIISTISIIIVLYLGILFLVFFNQSSFIFFPVKLSTDPVFLSQLNKNEIDFKHDEIFLHGWILNPGRSKVMFYYGGNAEEVSLNLDDFIKFTEYSTVFINYRGYGKSGGKPGQDVLFSDALFIFDQIINKAEEKYEEIVLFGRSLGSGIATYVASQRKVDKIILVTPYDSIRGIAKSHFPFLPVDLLLKHPFDSIEYSRKIDVPALILYAEFDNIIPYRNTEKLIKQLGSICKPIMIEKTDHNSIQLSDKYWNSINSFLTDQHR
jgi:alpha-beta hydrolase superfamily lysophospholipase